MSPSSFVASRLWVRLYTRQIKRGPQSSDASPIEHRVLSRRQKIGARHEPVDHLVERDCAATGNEAIAPFLGTLVERAEPAQIGVVSRIEHEDIELVRHNAGVGPRYKRLAQGTIGRPVYFAKTLLQFDPERQIEIAALMPNLDALTTEIAETRNLLPQRLRHRAYHGNRMDLRKRHPRIRHDIGCHAKPALLNQQIFVLLLDLRAPHRFTPAAS